MGIKRINEFPEGSGSLTSDDIFLFMDDPSGSGITKKISLSQISNSIGGGPGGNSFNQSLNTNDSPTFNNIAITGSKIYGGGENSGDGNGYGTIELIPDSGLYTNDQYLIVDPTGPNHIHLRAGGTQDNSNAELIVGGEKTHLLIRDNDQTVRLETETTVSIISYYFTSSSGFSSAVWETVDNTNRIVINNPNSDVYNAVTSFSSPSVFSVVDNVNNPILTITGSQTPGDPSPIILTVEEAPPSNPTNLDQLVFEINQNRNSYISVNGSDIRMEAADDVRIYSNDVFRLYNNSSSDPIEIVTDYNGDEYWWRFEADGNLQIPGNILLNNGTSVAIGTFDNNTGGNNGISLNCAVGYELNWQGGHLKNTQDNGISSSNILCDSAIELPGSGIDNVEINNSGIIFSDGTSQNTAWSGTINTNQINNFNNSVSGLLPLIANSGDNRLLTNTGSINGINAESNLTFDGSSLNISGNIIVGDSLLSTSTISTVSGNLILSPNGSGAIQRSSFGITRGIYAVDLQNITDFSDQNKGSKGAYSIIVGGYDNVVEGNYSAAYGGLINSCSGEYSVVVGGANNSVYSVSSGVFLGAGAFNQSSGNYSVIVGGEENTVLGNYSTICGGARSFVSGIFSSIVGGYDNQIAAQSGYGSIIGGGSFNNISNESYGAILGGYNNRVVGNASNIVGGFNNFTYGDYTTICGGVDNRASGIYSVICGGSINTISSGSAFGLIIGGIGGDIDGDLSTVINGFNNNISGSVSTIVGGLYNNIGSGTYNLITGGAYNTISSTASYATIGGLSGIATLYGEQSYSAGTFDVNGDAQTRKFILRGRDTSNNTVNLKLDGNINGTQYLYIPEWTSWYYTIKVHARSTLNNTAAYHFDGIAINDANDGTSCTLLSNIKTVVHEDDANWDANISINWDINNNAYIDIVCSYDHTLEDINWVASVDVVQTKMPTITETSSSSGGSSEGTSSSGGSVSQSSSSSAGSEYFPNSIQVCGFGGVPNATFTKAPPGPVPEFDGKPYYQYIDGATTWSLYYSSSTDRYNIGTTLGSSSIYYNVQGFVANSSQWVAGPDNTSMGSPGNTYDYNTTPTCP